jgi:hypothetical protein
VIGGKITIIVPFVGFGIGFVSDIGDIIGENLGTGKLLECLLGVL